MMSELRILETPLGPATLRRSNRRTLAISVLPDGALELVAPEDAAEDAILGKISKRSRWILNQRRIFGELNSAPAQRRFVSGATHRYLGRQYRLKVTVGNACSVALKGGYFQITASTPEEVEKALNLWFRNRAKEQFAKRLALWTDWCRKQRLPEPRLQLRYMPKRWGSAGRDGRITLNPELIHAPGPCVDYVIVHEICHLKHPAHDRAFFRLLGYLLPDWRRMKQRLEEAEFS